MQLINEARNKLSNNPPPQVLRVYAGADNQAARSAIYSSCR